MEQKKPCLLLKSLKKSLTKAKPFDIINLTKGKENKNMMTTNEMITYDRIVELGIATVDEINLAFNVAQTTWTELLNRIVYARTGYRTVEDYIESEDEED